MAFKDNFKIFPTGTENDTSLVYFKWVNEILPAIMESLEPKETDEVLSICGSIDQPLAFLEYAKSVVAVDNQITQLEFAYDRLRHVKSRKFKKFRQHGIEPEETQHTLVLNRNKYFDDERLEKIAQKTDNLSFIEKNIYHLDIDLYDVDIIYLSNAMTTGVLGLFDKIVDRVKPGTKIYTAREFMFFKNELVKIDNEKTRIARNIEDKFNTKYNWVPTIYVKK